MSSCHVRELSNVYHALFEDIKYAYPTLEAEFERDLTRLDYLSLERGLEFYLKYLPAAGKHFDRCLDAGQYSRASVPLTKRVSALVIVPRFLRGLHLLVFETDGRLKDEPDIQAIMFLRQVYYLGKKMKLGFEQDDVTDCVCDLVSEDESLPEPSGFWKARTPSDLSADYRPLEFTQDVEIRRHLADRVVHDHTRSLVLANLETISKMVCSTLGHYDPREWSFRHGPGAVAQVSGPTNKYFWSSWSHQLEQVYPVADFGYHNLGAWAAYCDWELNDEPSFSRLVAVPKTYRKPRLIAAEPSEHQWCQQNCWHYIDSRVASSWIHNFVRFHDQSLNQELCRYGSLDGSLATLDLSSASDRVTCNVVEHVFGYNQGLLRALRASRTPSLVQNLTEHAPFVIELRKFSTMGSALTFPIETLIFLTISLAACAANRGIRVHRVSDLESLAGEVSVFGDDIVVPRDSRALVVDTLEACWFRVNTDKSFWGENFRESCGVDSFRGCDVTPTYMNRVNDRKPESIASTLALRNHLYSKWYLCAAAYCESTLPDGFRPVTPDSGSVGLITRTEPEDYPPMRYNPDLQRVEIWTRVFKTRVAKLQTGGHTALHQYFTENPSPFDKWEHGVVQRGKLVHQLHWAPVYP